jgi:hypothetical protein
MSTLHRENSVSCVFRVHTRSWDDINYAYSSTKLVCSKSSDHVVPTSGSGNLPSLRLSPIHRDTPEACVSLYSSQYTAAFSVGIGFPSISHYSYLIAMKPRRYKPCQLKKWQAGQSWLLKWQMR